MATNWVCLEFIPVGHISKWTWCLMSTETIRLIRDREKGVWRWSRLYTYCYTVTTRMTSALRWAVMTAILMFHNCEGQSHKTVSTDHNLWSERRAEADLNRGPSAYQPTALPLGQTGSQGTHFHYGSLHTYWRELTLSRHTYKER